MPYIIIIVGYPKNDDANKLINRYDSDRAHYSKYRK